LHQGNGLEILYSFNGVKNRNVNMLLQLNVIAGVAYDPLMAL